MALNTVFPALIPVTGPITILTVCHISDGADSTLFKNKEKWPQLQRSQPKQKNGKVLTCKYKYTGIS